MNTASPHPGYRHFKQLPLSMRFLYSGALCILGLGYLFALIHLFFTYAGKDGDASSVSYEDMVIAYSGTGKVLTADPALGYVELDHDPIPALQWPRMTMGFYAEDKAQVGAIKEGDRVEFEVYPLPNKEGDFVLRRIAPKAAK